MTQRIWHGILASGRTHRYYLRLSEKFRRRYEYLTLLIAVAFSSAAGTLIGQLPDMVGAILLFVASTLLIALLRTDYSAKAEAAGNIARQTAKLNEEWYNLWFDQYRDDVTECHENLSARLRDITHQYAGPQDDKLLIKCTEEAEKDAVYTLRAA